MTIRNDTAVRTRCWVILPEKENWDAKLMLKLPGIEQYVKLPEILTVAVVTWVISVLVELPNLN